MTQEPVRYEVQGPGRFLDPCINPDRFPRQLALVAPQPGWMTEHRRQKAALALESVREEIASRLRRQVWCFEDGERRWVHLWSGVELSVARDGSDFRSRFLDYVPDAGRFVASADLSQPIGGFAFVAAFSPLLVQASRENGLNPSVLGARTGDWMRIVIRRNYRHCVDWNRLRRSVLAFLRPDPLLYALTRRTFEDAFPTIDHFNWVERHQRELAQVGIERPRLLPFLQIVGHVETGSPLENFERIIADAGITPSARRKLERWGWEPFSQVCEAAILECPVELMARYANLLDRLQVADTPPSHFTRLTLYGNSFAPDWYLRALLDEIERLEYDVPEATCPLDFEDTRKWVMSGAAKPDPNQQRAGWTWIVEQAWQHKLATDASVRQPWAVPCEAFSIGAHRMVPLRTLLELREEAVAMANCLADFSDDCAEGRMAIFSIRDDLTGARIACFSLSRVRKPTPFWQVLQVAGKENAEVAPAILELAMGTAARLNGGGRNA